MATQISSASRGNGLLRCSRSSVVGALERLHPETQRPEPVAEQFFAALAKGDTAAAAELSDRPDDARGPR